MEKMRQILPYLLFTIVMILAQCIADNKSTASLTSDTAISIPIENVTVNLPTTSAYQLIQTNCLMCHSAKYIEMQPALSRTEWQKVVNKMVKNYGAPISDTASIRQIIDYLTQLKN